MVAAAPDATAVPHLRNRFHHHQLAQAPSVSQAQHSVMVATAPAALRATAVPDLGNGFHHHHLAQAPSVSEAQNSVMVAAQQLHHSAAPGATAVQHLGKGFHHNQLPQAPLVSQAPGTNPTPPKAPEKPLSAYMRFSKKFHRSIKAENPELKIWEIGSIIGGKWRNLKAHEKNEYQDAWRADKTKYEAAIAAYRQSPEYGDWLKAVRAPANQASQAPEEYVRLPALKTVDFPSVEVPLKKAELVFTEPANIVENASASLEHDPLGNIKIESSEETKRNVPWKEF